MPMRPAFGRPMDRTPPQLTSPSENIRELVIAAALYPNRAKRVTGMAAPFVLRCSVSPWLRVDPVSPPNSAASLSS